MVNIYIFHAKNPLSYRIFTVKNHLRKGTLHCEDSVEKNNIFRVKHKNIYSQSLRYVNVINLSEGMIYFLALGKITSRR